MVDLERIYEDYEHMGIPIFSFPAGKLRAATIEIDQQYAVFADFFQFKTLAEQQHMLVHELGHCATGCTHKLASRYDLIEKHEFRADKYAALRYLPPAQFVEAFQSGYKEPWELANWFNMPEDFIRWTLAYYTDNNLLDLAM